VRKKEIDELTRDISLLEHQVEAMFRLGDALRFYTDYLKHYRDVLAQEESEKHG
jgi:hypothetical protein